MSAVSLLQEERLTRAENALGRLGNSRQFLIPELIIRAEQALKMHGNADLFEPMLERLRELDEMQAQNTDDVLELYKMIGGKVRE